MLHVTYDERSSRQEPRFEDARLPQLLLHSLRHHQWRGQMHGPAATLEPSPLRPSMPLLCLPLPRGRPDNLAELWRNDVRRNEFFFQKIVVLLKAIRNTVTTPSQLPDVVTGTRF